LIGLWQSALVIASQPPNRVRPTADPVTTEWRDHVNQWLHDIGVL